MGFAWTEEQQQVIDARKKNILVSAAAGSGKTAVLVERIVRMITDPAQPIDIDRLLIVTFTNAAAAEMKERIARAVEQRLETDPDDVHLQRQLTLIQNAQITTIHSFCLYVIRNYFHVIELDPGFRVADEGELKLLKSDVASQLLEDAYASGEQAFVDFVECYSTGKSDKGLEDLILSLYEFSMSYPWPEEWIRGCTRSYQLKSEEDMETSAWMQALKSHIFSCLADVRRELERGLDMIRESDGPYMYENVFREELAMVERFIACPSYAELAKAWDNMSFGRLSSRKDENVSDQKRNQVKAIQEGAKKTLGKLKSQYFYTTPEEALQDIKESARPVGVLMELVLEFSHRFREIKRSKNLVDFHDLEHYALEILVEKTEDGWEPRAAAEDFREHFVEILIDEYQDSNLVQELILNSISRERSGQPNIFMVGDVKQSIYRFRLARPELFMEKYDTYSKDENAAYHRIDLKRNFRSREEVIGSVNEIFGLIMKKSLGNIEYDEDARLYPGASYPESPSDNRTEILLVDLDSRQELTVETEENAKELEARAIAGKIRQLVREQDIWDSETQTFRRARYRDIVILLRTVSGWAETITNVLMEAGIPAHTASRTGYFSTPEVGTVLNMLRIIDNPMQDLPLAAVLRSPAGNLSNEELAMVKSSYPELRFYEACETYELEGSDPVLKEKLSRFYRMFCGFREQVPYTPIHQLLWEVLQETGFADYAAAQAGGAQRHANLNMLVEKALEFETTSYRGLFHFIRYIEQLEKYQVDFGEASILSENENAVRIMSIHKSKGLEFPIVFAAGLGKSFNKQDSRSRIVLHPDLGAGADEIDPKLRLRIPTLLKKAIQTQSELENLGEELRVLYVALTRAKEKLILSGAAKHLAEKQDLYETSDATPPSFLDLSGAGSYLDWLLPLVLGGQVKMKASVLSMGELVELEAIRQVTGRMTRETLKNWDPETIYDAEVRGELEKCLVYQYPYEQEAGLKSKLSVSEIKRMGQLEPEEPGEQLYEEQTVIPLIPKFIRQDEEGVTGAELGTAYHKVLECLEYEKMRDIRAIREKIRELSLEGKFSPVVGKALNPRKIQSFGKTGLARRMEEARVRGELYREQPFMIQVPAREISPEYQGDSQVLIQGIIDAFFLEEDGIVVVDYKTDHVGQGGREELLRRYGVQLDYYQKALERLTGKRVKEKIIYSLALEEEIYVTQGVYK